MNTHTRESIYIIIINVYTQTRARTHTHYTLIMFVIYIWRGSLLCDGCSGVRVPVDRVRKTNDRCTPRTSVLPVRFYFLFLFCVYSA